MIIKVEVNNIIKVSNTIRAYTRVHKYSKLMNDPI